MIPEKVKRPKHLNGKTVKVATGCGNMYVTLNSLDDGTPFEVFASLGKSGACAKCESEAVTRTVTLGLRYGIPVTEFVEQLIGIQCPNPMPFPKNERVLSCPDGIAKALKSHWMKEEPDGHAEPDSRPPA